MSRTTALDRLPRELDYRENDGLEVWLLWDESADRLFVLVVDSRAEDFFELTVSAEDAFDAFHHPYAYAASSGVTYRAAQRPEAVTAER
jgi:hypothetical protein